MYIHITLALRYSLHRTVGQQYQYSNNGKGHTQVPVATAAHGPTYSVTHGSNGALVLHWGVQQILTSQLSTLLRHLPMKWMFSTLLFRSLTVCATSFIPSTADFMRSESGWLLSVYLRSSWETVKFKARVLNACGNTLTISGGDDFPNKCTWQVILRVADTC